MLSYINLRDVVAVVSADAPGLEVRIIAEVTGVPSVSLVTSPGFIKARPLYAHMLRTELDADLRALRGRAGLHTEIDLCAWLDSPALHLCLWPEWFDHEQTRRIHNAVTVGFMWPEMACGSTRPVVTDAEVVVSGGSSTVAGADFFQTAVEAVRGLNRDTLVVTSHRHLLPSELPSHVRTVSRVDSIPQLLAEAALVIHHGGMGLISNAIDVGIPQLILAFGGDRPDNARHVERTRIGRFVPRSEWVNTRRIQSYVSELLRERDEIRARCARLRTNLLPPDVATRRALASVLCAEAT
jgi:UDP:flavonoid glycosyltransferase YjiC (YdhE family)